MNNGEAIKIINQYDMNFHWNDGEPIPASQLAEAFDLAISALKKQEEDRWHSIAKEGKPKESGTYIWICDDGTHRKLVTVAKYFKRTGECMLTGARSYWKAKAWKPLPEPYEEEKNNDDVD